MNDIDIERYMKRMETVVANNSDPEMAHINADDILCELLDELGYADLVDIYNKVEKWHA